MGAKSAAIRGELETSRQGAAADGDGWGAVTFAMARVVRTKPTANSTGCWGPTRRVQPTQSSAFGDVPTSMSRGSALILPRLLWQQRRW